MSHFLNCKECVDLLMDYLEGNLDADTEGRLDEHFSSCPPCLNFVENYRATSRIAGQLRDQEVEIPPELEDRLKSFLRQELGKVR